MEYDKAVDALQLIDRVIELNKAKGVTLEELRKAIQEEVVRTRPPGTPTVKRPRKFYDPTLGI